MNAHRGSKLGLLSTGAVALATILVSATASAQDAAPPAPMPTTTAAPADAAGTDHGRVIGRLAVGFLGVTGMSVGTGGYANGGYRCGQVNPNSPANTTPNPSCVPALTGSHQVDAPVIGVRYWFNDRFGLDAGLGIGIYSGSTTRYPYPDNTIDNATKFTQDKTSYTAFILHGGVPIALATGRHFTFEVIPELDIGFGSGTQKDQQQPAQAVPAGQQQQPVPLPRDDLKLGGFLFDVGARIGGEIQLGFIGIPELALQATVGVRVVVTSTKVSTGGKDATSSDTSIATSVQQAPWALFTNNIAALYYF